MRKILKLRRNRLPAASWAGHDPVARDRKRHENQVLAIARETPKGVHRMVAELQFSLGVLMVEVWQW